MLDNELPCEDYYDYRNEKIKCGIPANTMIYFQGGKPEGQTILIEQWYHTPSNKKLEWEEVKYIMETLEEIESEQEFNKFFEELKEE